jgi:hypothetical protein
MCCLQFDVGNLIAQFAHEIHDGIHSETVFPHFPCIFHGDVPPESVGSGSLVIVVSEKLLTINDSRQLNPIQPCWCTEIGIGGTRKSLPFLQDHSNDSNVFFPGCNCYAGPSV